VRCLRGRTIRRAALAIALAAVSAVSALQAADSSLAAVGTGPGQLLLSPATGPLATTPTWSTTTACPAGFQGSAAITEYTLSGTAVSLISFIVESGLTAPFSGLLDGNVGALLRTAGSGLSATNPGTDEWVVGCYSGGGGTGSFVNVQSTFVTATASGTYTTSAAGPTATTTTLTALPSPAPSGGTETLTASVTAADGTSPAGTVQCQSGGINIGAALPVNTGGVAAAATTTFTAPTTTVSTATVALSAVFTATNVTGAYAGSTGTFSLLVQSSGALLAGVIPVDVSVPASGSLTVTVSPGPISLTIQGMGSQPGNLQLNPASGPLTTSPTWSTTTACPAGFQAGASLFESGTLGLGTAQPNAAIISPVVFPVSAPFSGTLNPGGVAAALNSVTGVSASNPTVEWVVGCWSGPNVGTGNVAFVQSTLVTVAPDGTTYTTSVPPPPTPPQIATGDLNTVTLTDTRNTYPRWSVSGQVSGFTGTGLVTAYTIPGDSLGWTPRFIGVSLSPPGNEAVLGPVIAPGTSPGGLGDAPAPLAHAPAGSGVGTFQFTAGLALDIPSAAPAGSYSATMTITYLQTGP
jgi:hypothetical protein